MINNDGYIDVLLHDKREYILIYLGASDGFSASRTLNVPCHGNWRFCFPQSRRFER